MNVNDLVLSIFAMLVMGGVAFGVLWQGEYPKPEWKVEVRQFQDENRSTQREIMDTMAQRDQALKTVKDFMEAGTRFTEKDGNVLEARIIELIENHQHIELMKIPHEK